MAESAPRRASTLTPEERQRLEAKLLAGAPSTRSALPRRDPAAPVPLSPTQQRLWFLHQLVPDSAAYHVPLTVRLRGRLDVEALRRSFEVIVHRHEALRTGIVVEDGEPCQRIAPGGAFTLPVDPWSDGDDAALERAAVREANQVFDLERGPLIRARLFRRNADEHLLVVTLHHLISDGWSMGVLAGELETAYAALRAGRAPTLPPLPLQYGDYAVWQRERLGGAELQAQLAYWTERLAGAPAALTIPTDRPRPTVQSFAGGHVPITVSRDVTEGLRALARRHGATLYMTLLAAFQVLLARHAGQDDVLIGSPIAGRPRIELEGLIGFFANTMVLRGELAGDPTFCKLLRRTRDTALGAFANAEVPFERLVETLRPARDASRNPVFQAILALQNAPRTPLALAGLGVMPFPLDQGTAKVDYSLILVEVPEGLRGTLEYCSALFDRPTAEGLVAQFGRLLQEIARDADRPISQLPLLGEAERHRVLVEWNATRSPYPADRSVPALFAEHVARTPDAVAVTDGARTITYAELERRARRLAHRLCDLGIGRGVRVGVCCDRSIELVVALLGVLTAGSAYVPLDPSHPAERRTALLDDAGAVAVVTAGAGRGDARPEVRLESSDGEALEAPAAEPLALRGADLAYVMYTSGSTGAPKGVAVPHRAIARLVRDTDYVRLGPDDVVAHVSNPAFDAATFEIWGALLNGARLVLIPPDTALAPRALAGALAREGVTTVFLTTSLFNQVAREAPDAFRTLRQVLFGGETAEPRWVRTVLRAAPPARLINGYGPTETTTFATWHEVREVAEGASTVPIGRPIANTEIYILDGRREPVPVGVVGEIYIGGPGLADGYLGRPELTAERFVPHPFDSTPGARLYRTGDRARFRADGVVEFLGRLDRQVKLRGHRIEPDEIEAALLRLPEVGHAVVVMEGEASDTHRLVAYVAPAPGASPRPTEIRNALRLTLPAFMVPGAVVVLPVLPLTPNGKLDRAALPAARPDEELERAPRVPPSNPTERTLVAIWEEMLGIRGVGVRESFFDLGGHSLLAARMMDLVERKLGRRLPLTTLFTSPTVEHLARALHDEVATSEPPVVVLNSAGARPPLFFCHGVFNGGGFFTRALAEAAGVEQPFYAVHPHSLQGTAVPDTIEAMAATHLSDILAVRPRGPYLLGGHCNGALVALEVARLLRARGEEVPLVVMLDAVAPPRVVRMLGALAWAVDAVLCVPATRRDDRLIRWRIRAEDVAVWLRYYRGRLDAAGGRGLVGWLRGLAAIARKKIVTRGRRPDVAASLDGAPDPPPRASSPLAAHYKRAVNRYIPGPYHGRIVVLRSADSADPRPDFGWSSICSRVTTYTVPGGHLSAITHHVRTTAERLRACLEEASRA
jgi:amino acid adenylation domain-containing protein